VPTVLIAKVKFSENRALSVSAETAGYFGEEMETIDELSRFAAIACLDIFKDYDREELEKVSLSVNYAWHVGKRLQARQDFLDSLEEK